MPADWRLAKPVPLDSIELVFTQAPAPVITGHHEETRPLRPLVSPQRRYDRYHKAMRDLDRPRLFENRVCYRLLGVEWVPAHEAATLTFGHMRYFDMIDVGELLADPFGLHTYPLLLSNMTATRSHSGPSPRRTRPGGSASSPSGSPLTR